MHEVRVAGVGMTPFGDHGDRTGRDLFGDAGQAALADAGIDGGSIDEVLVGNFMGELAEHQGHQAPIAAECLGTTAPSTRLEIACASGGAAIRQAVSQIRSGQADVVVAGGFERMTNLTTAGATEALAIAADDLWEVRAGVTFPGAYALMARRYFDQFDGDRETMAHIAVKNHANASSNKKAHFQQEIDVEDVLAAPTVASPLGLYDACPISDGAAAVVLASESFVAEAGREASIGITGSGQASDALAVQNRPQMTATPATETAAASAYEDAGVTPDDIDCLEVHDCFTIAEALALEGLGFYEPGEGLGAARRGETTKAGDLPVNLSGGLKAKGHPVGATGVSQVVAMTRLLRGDHHNADAVPDPEVGLTHNAGGTVATAVVHILEVVQ